MEHPSSKPGGAFLLPVPEGETVTDFLWDAVFDESSFLTPGSDRQVNPTDSAANPTCPSAARPDLANVVIGPTTCASQATRAASRVRAEIDLISFNRIPDAGPRWSAPVAAQRAVPPPPSVPPSALSDIARTYTTHVSSRAPGWPRSTSVSTYSPSSWDVIYSGCPVDATHWLPANPNQDVACLPHQRLENPVDMGSLPTMDLPYPSFDPIVQQSQAHAQWISFTNSDLNPTSRGNEPFLLSSPSLDTASGSFNTLPGICDSESPTNNHKTSSRYRTSYPLSPESHVGEGAADCDHGRRASTVSAGVSIPSAAAPTPPPPKARRSARQPTISTAPLAIVQYRPNSSTDNKLSRKRPAFEELTPQGMTSQTLRQVLVHDDDGEVKGTMFTFGNRVKTRAVFSEEKRQRTAQARREGVCPRCKRSKRQCDLAQQQSLYVSCTLCSATKIYKNAPRFPCFKASLADILFFRSRPAENEPFFTKRSMVYDLGDLSKPDVPVRTLKLTQQIGHHQLTVYASEFVPLPSDVVSYKWRDRSGKPHELKMPPFCLTNIDKIHSHICQYIASAKWSYLKSLKSEDELAWMTVSAAVQFAKSRPESLVADALSLWAISRMIEIPWQMCGDELTDTLGVFPVRDPTSPHNGRIPIPPIMDTQLDQIFIQFILKPLRVRVIQKFEQLITPAKPDTWWEVYLSAFILLNHIERLARHSVAHARTHTMASKYSNIPFLEGAFHTAKSILARFHFICNGSAPLRLDWKSPKVAAMAKLEPDQVRFMQKTQAMIAARENDVLSLRRTHKYEQTLYWAGQLFTENFDTSPVHVVEELAEDEEEDEDEDEDEEEVGKFTVKSET